MIGWRERAWDEHFINRSLIDILVDKLVDKSCFNFIKASIPKNYYKKIKLNSIEGKRFIFLNIFKRKKLKEWKTDGRDKVEMRWIDLGFHQSLWNDLIDDQNNIIFIYWIGRWERDKIYIWEILCKNIINWSIYLTFLIWERGISS